MLCLNISYIAIITVKGVITIILIIKLANLNQLSSVLDYPGYSKNQVHYHENLNKPKNLESKNIFKDKKSYKDLPS